MAPRRRPDRLWHVGILRPDHRRTTGGPLRITPSVLALLDRAGGGRSHSLRSGGEIAHRRSEVDTEVEDRQRRGRYPIGHVALDVVSAALRRSVHDELVDELIGNGGDRRLTVPG